MEKKENLSGIRFVRINGRIVPMKVGLFSEKRFTGSKAKRMVAQQRENSPKERAAARKLMFGAGVSYGIGGMAGGAAAMMPLTSNRAKTIAKRMGIFGGLAIATAAGLGIAAAVKSGRAAEFRQADEGGKGVLKNLGNALGDVAIAGAGIAAPILAVKYGHKLKQAMKATKSGQSVVSKYDIISKFKASRAKPVAPKKKYGK